MHYYVAMIEFPEKLSLAQLPTPFQPLHRLSEKVGGPLIWVKRDDMTGCAASGNKVRKLEYTLAKAVAEGCDTLITCGGLQSNHCRATAVLGAQLGLKVQLILREEGSLSSVDGNLLLDHLVGAEVSTYPAREYQQNLPQLFDHWQQHYQSQGRKPYRIPTGASDGSGVWGYIGCARELKEDFQQAKIQPSAIVHATGSGGTQAGLTVGADLFNLGCPVIGMAVCDDEAYFQHKVQEDITDWQQLYNVVEGQSGLSTQTLDIQVNDAYIGPGYAKATPEVFATIREAASLEGLVFDPVYSGKAFHGLLEEIRRGTYASASDVVFIHTGGIFGLLAQKSQLGF